MPQTSNQNFTVVIIGGGYCGTMLAIHLLSQSKIPVHIVFINSGYPLSKGAAFSSYSHKHLLNVAAKNMSAYADKPDHFINWIRKHENYCVIDAVALPEMFLPRNIYGYYLKDIFDSAIRNKSENISISFVHDEAIDVELKDKKAHVYFSVSPSVTADKVVLATGNETPENAKIENTLFYRSKNYFENPWLHEAVNHLDPQKDVLIIGNGLTMVDVVIGLKEKKHRGKIYSLSPNGFRILPHRQFTPYKDLVEELSPPYDLVKLVKLFRKHVKKLRSENLAGEAAVDSLRPLTQEIWMSWSLKEKQRFMYHIRHMWGLARHRLPMHVHQQIQQYILDGTLEIVAGRLINIIEDDSAIAVTFKRRSNQEENKLYVGRVINCTGPQPDIGKIQKPLFENLLSRNMICADEMKLGIHASPDGTVLSREGIPSERLFTMGSNLKGILWESTAVPELRVQAKNLSEKIVASFEKLMVLDSEMNAN